MKNGQAPCRVKIDGKPVDARLVRVWIGASGQSQQAEVEFDAGILKKALAGSGSEEEDSNLQEIVRGKLNQSIDATIKWLLQIGQAAVREAMPIRRRFGIFKIKPADPDPTWYWTSVKTVTDRGKTISIGGTVVPIAGAKAL